MRATGGVTVAGVKDKGFNLGYNDNIPKARVDLYAGMVWNQLDTAGASSVDDTYLRAGSLFVADPSPPDPDPRH